MALGLGCMRGEVPHSVTLSRGLGEREATIKKEKGKKTPKGEGASHYGTKIKYI